MKYSIISIFFSLSFCLNTYATVLNDSCYIAQITSAITDSFADVEERPDGSLYVNSSDLELAFDPDHGSQIVGLRFTDLPIPNDALIEKAYIQFTADEAQNETCHLSINAEAKGLAPDFDDTFFNLSQRTKTNATVAWSPPPWNVEGDAGTAQQSPDLSAIIQEVVSFPNWEQGNPILILIEGTGRRTAFSADRDPDFAPRLIIEFALPLPSQPIDSLFINELMASNSTIFDAFGEADDWLELYNASSQPVNIGGLFLSDNLEEPLKWQIRVPIVIPPHNFVLIWADGEPEQGGLHTNFKLKSGGEELILTQQLQGELRTVDAIVFDEVPENVTFGRTPNGSETWALLAEPSPSSSNDNALFWLDVDVQFSLQSGFYSSTQTLTLTSTDPDVEIRYALEGTIPDTSSLLYETPIAITQNSVVSARAFKPGFASTQISSGTFFINENITLPRISIQTEPQNLWDNQTGIYITGSNGVTGFCSETPRNWNQPWERPARISYFEADGTPGFEVGAGIKIGGGCSRGAKMKGLNFFLREGLYGDYEIDYPLFPEIETTKFRRLKIRNSGNDFEQLLFRDGILHWLLRDQINLDLMAYRPVIVFINGEYWGIYGLREFYNEDYIATHHPVDADSLDIITNPFASWRELKEGDMEAFFELESFMSIHNLSQPERFAEVEEMIDVNQWLNYYIVQIYLSAYDWPANNMELWRDRKGGKWRFLLYDLDATTNYGFWSQSFAQTNTLEFATSANGPDWPNGPSSTLFLRRLLENIFFRNEFIQRTCTYMNTIYHPQRVNRFTDSLVQILEPEMPRHISRWQGFDHLGWGNPSGSSINQWKNYINTFKSFFIQRPNSIRNHINSKFNLQSTYDLTFIYNENTNGQLFIHSNELDVPFHFECKYFKNVPIKIKAIADEGFVFFKWLETGDTNPEIDFSGNENTTLTPIFIPKAPVITEIHYQPKEGEDYEFIEIYNPLSETIDLSGFQFSKGIDFVFPDDVFLPEGEFVLLVREPSLYVGLGCQVFQYNGDLNNNGEVLELVTANGKIVDKVEWKTTAPWPFEAAGQGPSLSLKLPHLPNEWGENWEAGIYGGSPCGKMSPMLPEPPENEVDIQLFPNPVRDKLTVSYFWLTEEDLKLEVVNVLGQVMYEQLAAPDIFRTEIEIDVKDWSLGMYVLKMENAEEEVVRKFLVQ